ncbi:PH domain-containing protein [Prauserella cavernicola]|uniref:PH domain-containing protein n=1 Tax=Prauserella cavernicola TaxID=2800127 RepID=A0A934V7Y6_9PSEU|nr:PH domain-containing protein [Prauserella cavernicola]
MASALALLLVTVFTVVAVLLRNSETGVIFQVSDQVAMIGVGVLLGGASLLFAMPKVKADAEGIDVRNVLVSRRFAWSEVLSVSFPDGASFARLELPEDEYHSVLAVQSVDRARAVEAVRALRRLHKAARGE